MAANKRVGKKSLAQNDNLFPAAPLIGTATDVGIARPFDNGSATVSFTAQGPNAATSYIVTSSVGGYTATGTSSPITIEGLKSGVNYSFTVAGINQYGTGPESSASNTITATTVPAKPAAPTVTTVAIGGDVPQGSANTAKDTVTWTAPADGGKALALYYWTSSDGKSGNTTSTSIEVNQESGTSQTYNVYATNVNGQSLVSDSSASVTSAFSFTPFGAFGFSPFGAFGFSPFGAFGFSPFGAFGFSPFGFSPFGAFGFSPFGFSPFGFSPYAPRCIAGNTKIATVGEDGNVKWVPAKEILVGDKVFSPVWDEFDGTPSPYESRIEYDSLTNKRIGIGEISFVLEKKVPESIILNNNGDKHYSLTQPILARKPGQKDAWEFTGDIVPGDIVWEYDFEENKYVEVEIFEISKIAQENDVFQISVSGIDTFVAGGVISHNK